MLLCVSFGHHHGNLMFEIQRFFFCITHLARLVWHDVQQTSDENIKALSVAVEFDIMKAVLSLGEDIYANRWLFPPLWHDCSYLQANLISMNWTVFCVWLLQGLMISLTCTAYSSSLLPLSDGSTTVSRSGIITFWYNKLGICGPYTFTADHPWPFK